MMRAVYLSYLTALVLLRSESSIVKDYCAEKLFKPVCNSSQVVVLEQATFGRWYRESDTCGQDNFGYWCEENVLPELDALCSGRWSCQLQVLQSSFPRRRACHPVLKSLLRVRHNCVTVAQPGHQCRGPVSAPPGPTGFLASLVATETGCGSTQAPWIVSVARGQRIRLDLYDFSRWQTNLSSTSVSRTGAAARKAAGSGREICRVYATVKEPKGMSSVTVCGGDKRISTVYTSRTHSVEIRILTAGNQPQTPDAFLLKYTALGCPDIDVGAGAYAKRNHAHGNTMEVGCLSPRTAQVLECRGTKWSGSVPVCVSTTGTPVTTSKSATKPGSHSAPSGGGGKWSIHSFMSAEVTVIIIVGIALGVGLSILLFGLACLRRGFPQRNVPVVELDAKDVCTDPVCNAGTLQHGKISASGLYGTIGRYKDSPSRRELDDQPTMLPSNLPPPPAVLQDAMGRRLVAAQSCVYDTATTIPQTAVLAGRMS